MLEVLPLLGRTHEEIWRNRAEDFLQDLHLLAGLLNLAVIEAFNILLVIFILRMSFVTIILLTLVLLNQNRIFQFGLSFNIIQLRLTMIVMFSNTLLGQLLAVFGLILLLLLWLLLLWLWLLLRLLGFVLFLFLLFLRPLLLLPHFNYLISAFAFVIAAVDQLAVVFISPALAACRLLFVLLLLLLLRRLLHRLLFILRVFLQGLFIEPVELRYLVKLLSIRWGEGSLILFNNHTIISPV